MQGRTSEFRGSEGNWQVLSTGPAKYLNVKVADLLAQRIAVHPEKICGPDLVAAGRGQGCRQQRVLNLPQHAVIQAGRRQLPSEARKIRGEMAFNRRGKAIARL